MSDRWIVPELAGPGQVRDCSGTLSRSAASGTEGMQTFLGPSSPIEAEAL